MGDTGWLMGAPFCADTFLYFGQMGVQKSHGNVKYVDGIKFSCSGCRQVDAFTNFDQAKSFALANPNYNLVGGTNTLNSIKIFATSTSPSMAFYPREIRPWRHQRFIDGIEEPFYETTGVLNIFQTVVHEIGHNSNLNIQHGNPMHEWEYSHIKKHL